MLHPLIEKSFSARLRYKCSEFGGFGLAYRFRNPLFFRMASALSATSVSAALLQKPISGPTVKLCSTSVVVGLPALKAPKITCSPTKAVKEEKKTFLSNGNIGLGAAAMSALISSHAIALVDERLSTERTGLSLGLSNPTLGWI